MSPPDRAARLPLHVKVIYGTGDWSLSSFNTFRQIFYAIFLTDVVGVQPHLASFAALAGVAWDAVNDPLVGSLSDRVRTRWGRRRPFLLFASVPFGLAFVLLWWAPPWHSQAALALHASLAYIVSDTLQTVVSVPFYALTPELTPDYDERTALTAWRMLFNLAASLAVAVSAPAIVDAVVAAGFLPQQGYLVVASLFGVLGVIPFLAIAAVVRERPDALPEVQPPLLEVARGAWANRPFRSLGLLYMLNWITFDLVGLMIPFLVTYHVCAGDRSARTTLLGLTLPVESAMLGVLLVVAIPALPLWELASRRFGKRTSYLVATLYWAVVMLGIAFVPRGGVQVALALSALCGVGVAAAHVIPEAMVPDVIDADELATGRRNEGIYYGAKNLFRKAAGALAVFGALQTLGWAGYVAPPPGAVQVSQPDSVMLAIRLLSGPAGAALLVGAAVAAWSYTLTRERHAAIRAELEVRRASRP